MQVFQTAGDPPSDGRTSRATMGCTQNNSPALTKSVPVYSAGIHAFEPPWQQASGSVVRDGRVAPVVASADRLMMGLRPGGQGLARPQPRPETLPGRRAV